MKKYGPNDLFRLHDTEGIPLSIGILIAKEAGHAYAGLAAFFFDAMIAGWNPDTAFSTIEGACRDNDYPYDKKKFQYNLAVVATRCNFDWNTCSDFIKQKHKGSLNDRE